MLAQVILLLLVPLFVDMRAGAFEEADMFFPDLEDLRKALPINNPLHFDDALKENSYLFAMFTSPRCSKCQDAYVELEIIALEFEEENLQPSVKFCQVDGTTEGGIAIGKRFLPKPRFPQFLLFRNGPDDPAKYEGDRTAKALRAWIEKKTNHQLVVMETLVDVNEMKKMAKVYTLLGIFGSKDVAQRDAYTEASILIDEPCGVAEASIAKEFGVESPAVLIFTRYDGQEVYTPTSTKWHHGEITAWAIAHHFPLLSLFDDEFAPELFRSPLRVVALMFMPSYAVERHELLRQAQAAPGQDRKPGSWKKMVKKYHRNEFALQLRLSHSHGAGVEWPFAGEGCEPGWFGDDCDDGLGPAFSAFVAAAREHRSAAHFVVVPDTHGAVCGYFEVDCDSVSTSGARIVIADSRDRGGLVIKHHFDAGRPLSQISIFLSEFARGELSYTAKSEPVPDVMAGPGHVVKVVGANFDEAVLGPADATKEGGVPMDVLLYVYSEHCTFCKTFQDTYDAVARHFELEPRIRVAKIDADKNEHPLLADVKGFPTFRLYMSTGFMESYTLSQRTVPYFHHWIAKHTTLEDFTLKLSPDAYETDSTTEEEFEDHTEPYIESVELDGPSAEEEHHGHDEL